MSAERLPPHPTQSVDRSRALRFTLDGRQIDGYHGETIGAALCAAGVETLTRSFKYHRRRGLLCAAGNCSNCLMTVDGVPNVRTCVQPARDGSVVLSQHAWPSLEYDAQALFDWCGPLVPVGFYYKTFMRPRWLWPAYEHVLRHLAGLGRLSTALPREQHAERHHRHTDIAIVGGGPAGMTAAVAAARLDVSVLLIDDQPALGGHLRWSLLPSSGTQPDYELARDLVKQIQNHQGIECLHDASAFGLYEGPLLAVAQGDRLIKVRADRVIVAAGGFEHPLVFENNDLPGVFLSDGIRRLIRLYGVRPGRRAVVVVNDDRGLRSARELMAAGVAVHAIADARAAAAQHESLRAQGVEVYSEHTVLAAHGRRRVEAVTLTRLDEAGAPLAGSDRRVETDLLVLATGWEPNNALLAQAECRRSLDPDTGSFFAADLPSWLFAAGAVAGMRELSDVMKDGMLAGLRAAVALGAGTAADQAAAAAPVARRPSASIRPLATVSRGGPRQFVCLCEDVTVKDLHDTVREGFDDIQLLKRYSTVTMGPCQGRMCHQASVAICAEASGRTASSTGTTTARPPAMPIALGTLAGPAHEPVRRTPIHQQHTLSGATWMDMGAWKRPLVYSSVEEECAAVHERVGIIDVSTLGKLDVKGRDAAAFLEWLHPNRVANLKPGRIRYRLMLDDTGIIVDDGTIAHLTEDHFFVTTGTGALEMVEQSLEWWLAGSDRCAHVTNVTAAFAAINVAGPRSRDLLSRLTELDLSSEAVPYLGTALGDVAGVPAMLLRIGFVGELGYELHFPSEDADFLWGALLDAGRDLGIAPFGVEAQRVLRLEKLHIIPGHDTDALSTPFEANMAWSVKLDKPDFVGRAALTAMADAPPGKRLVGFATPAGVVPNEGDAVVWNGRPVGRVTSAKWSPHLKRAIGMAWLPAELADAAEFQIRTGGRMLTARVASEPFYDPNGERLKA